MRHTAVSDVMSTKVISASPQDSCAQLATMLHDAAVVRPDGDPTQRWWRPRHIHRHGPTAKADATTAAELMTTTVKTVTPSTRAAAAGRTMMEHHLGWMPVCNEARRVVGVLSRSDVLAIFSRDDASIRAEVVNDVLRPMLVDPAAVRVEVDGGVLTLDGELQTRGDAQMAVDLTGEVEGVVAVVDRLRFRTDERVTDVRAMPMY